MKVFQISMKLRSFSLEHSLPLAANPGRVGRQTRSTLHRISYCKRIQEPASRLTRVNSPRRETGFETRIHELKITTFVHVKAYGSPTRLGILTQTYSQTLRKRTPLRPGIAVRLWEVSAYKRFKNTNTIGVGCDSCLL